MAECFGNEVNECYRGSDRKTGMARLQASVLAVTSMTSPVKSAQLSQIVGELREIAQDQPYVVCAFLFVRDSFRHEL
ncbi:hypothetical protein C7402_103455 [Paraburkholderia unamae]|uniref:Uncharacterized protein n=1 Tax=Paraburkholderia unamae TaxID=219649 RepID=A0ABX5KYH2_9BURK|nr:hypothetical protein C7402_103455 [Paraburkholderia unamae]